MLSFFRENCVRSLFVHSSCNECITICPHNAIQLNEREIEIDADSCKNCGLCVTACEQGALQDDAYRFKYPTLKSDQKGYSCLSTDLMEGVVRLPCLGMLDETELITAANERKTPIHLWAGHCKTCSWKNGGLVLIKRIKQAKIIAAQINIPLHVEIHEQIDRDRTEKTKSTQREQVPGRNRRDLFFQGFKWLEKNSKAHVLKKADEVVEQVEAVEQFWVDTKNKTIKKSENEDLASHMQKKVTKRRYALLQLLKSRGKPVTEPIEGLAIPKKIESHCDACELCIHSCPSGAIHGKTENNEFRITFLPNYCLNCSICIDVCPKDAIKQSDKLATRLIHVEQAKCKKCDEYYVPFSKEDHLCVICKNKQSLLF